jgi:hypothetical protein
MMGSFKVRLIGMAMVALTAMGALTACGGGGEAASKSNADLLKDAVANMKAAKTYHMDADLMSQGQTVTLNGDVDLATNNVKLSMNAAGQAVDIVKVGSDTYQSMDGGKTYTKGSADAVPDLSSFTGMWASLKPEDIDKAKDALKDGTPATEKVDGADTKHMTGNAKDLSALSSSAGAGAAGTEGTIDFWVTTDAKPTVRQMKFAGKDTSGTETNGTFKWTKVDEPMNITAPPTTP